MEKKEPIFFYEREYYVFSNFSSFMVEWKGELYMTSEHVYQSEKFEDKTIKEIIKNTRSAHEALMTARTHKESIRRDWKLLSLML